MYTNSGIPEQAFGSRCADGHTGGFVCLRRRLRRILLIDRLCLIGYSRSMSNCSTRFNYGPLEKWWGEDFLACNNFFHAHCLCKKRRGIFYCCNLNLETHYNRIAWNRLQTFFFYLSHSWFALLSIIYCGPRGGKHMYESMKHCPTVGAALHFAFYV